MWDAYKLCAVSRGRLLEKFEMETKCMWIHLTLPGHFLNIHLGHGATDHSSEIMLSDPEGQNTTSSPRSSSRVYSLCFTKMKNLRGAVNPAPGWYPPPRPWASYRAPMRPALLACITGTLGGRRLYTSPRRGAQQTAFLPGLMRRDKLLISGRAKHQYNLTVEMEHRGQ